MKEAKDLLRVGDLFEQVRLQELPWGGRSPRDLTRARKGLYSRPEPPGHEVIREWVELVIPMPSEGHTERKAPVDSSAGAPLLCGRTRRTCRRGHSHPGGYDAEKE